MGRLKEAFTEVSDLWAYLTDNELFTEAELQLITSMYGYNTDTLNDALYARYGYRSLDQMLEEL
jgi:hypothetical protein